MIPKKAEECMALSLYSTKLNQLTFPMVYIKQTKYE